MKPSGFGVYFLTFMCAAWIILTLASARAGKWPIAGVCLVLAVSFGIRLYRMTQRQK